MFQIIRKNFSKKCIMAINIQIKLNPNLKIQTEGTILLDYKFLGDESKES